MEDASRGYYPNPGGNYHGGMPGMQMGNVQNIHPSNVPLHSSMSRSGAPVNHPNASNAIRYSTNTMPMSNVPMNINRGMPTMSSNIGLSQSARQIPNVNMSNRGMMPNTSISSSRGVQPALASQIPNRSHQGMVRMGNMNPIMQQSVPIPYNPPTHPGSYQAPLRTSQPMAPNQPTNQANFEMDFPALGGHSRQDPPGQKLNNEYTLRQDDFPALGGPQHSVEPTKDHQQHESIGPNQSFQPGSYSQLSNSNQVPQPAAASNLHRGAPGSTVYDQQHYQKQRQAAESNKYGLLGLLEFFRTTPQDLNMLDLTTLGLNLNAPGCLHSSFLSPFNNPPSKNNAETVRSYKQPAMQVAHSKIHNFSEETLFYIFYSMPNDVLQLYAAQELYNRSWRYQKAEQRWYTRVTTDGESKQVYFEPTTWDRVPKDLFGDVEILQQPHVK